MAEGRKRRTYALMPETGWRAINVSPPFALAFNPCRPLPNGTPGKGRPAIAIGWGGREVWRGDGFDTNPHHHPNPERGPNQAETAIGLEVEPGQTSFQAMIALFRMPYGIREILAKAGHGKIAERLCDADLEGAASMMEDLHEKELAAAA